MNPGPALSKAVLVVDAMLAKFSNPEKRQAAFDELARVHDKWLSVVYPVEQAMVVGGPEVALGVVGGLTCAGEDDCAPTSLPNPKDDTPTFLHRRPPLLDALHNPDKYVSPQGTQTVNSGPTAHFVVEGGQVTEVATETPPEAPKPSPDALPERATLRILSSCINPRFLRAELPDKRKVSIMILRGRRYRVGIELNCRLQQAAQAIYVPVV